MEPFVRGMPMLFLMLGMLIFLVGKMSSASKLASAPSESFDRF
jgi:Na+-transporting methylmalonyl-CoA/oxaloacetate decarboxylase gamma subunit